MEGAVRLTAALATVLAWAVTHQTNGHCGTSRHPSHHPRVTGHRGWRELTPPPAPIPAHMPQT